MILRLKRKQKKFQLALYKKKVISRDLEWCGMEIIVKNLIPIPKEWVIWVIFILIPNFLIEWEWKIPGNVC